MRTPFQQRLADARSWDYLDVLWFKIKVKKKWIAYLKAWQMILIYIVVSNFFPALHVLLFSVFLLGIIQSKLSRSERAVNEGNQFRPKDFQEEAVPSVYRDIALRQRLRKDRET
mmetsp:Transcript_42659/g.66816  ORF Transcript_42659/g.66816 Transcript_42659/m.66816 type:complete len:114 (+) Transcript_42659:157-498(+)